MPGLPMDIHNQSKNITAAAAAAAAAATAAVAAAAGRCITSLEKTANAEVSSRWQLVAWKTPLTRKTS